MQDIRRATIRELAYKIKGAKTPTPRFSFFLGAGASRQSGIPLVSEMIRHFREQIALQCCPAELKTDAEKNAWLAEQDWCKADGSDYCKYFEKFEPKEFGRQRHIEELIKDHEPSFGYVVLANLMASGHVNTIVTTNFDDLVYSACTTFTGIRPIVYAYGVLAAEMHFTAQRTKILKLHGDYLYSKLKNTNRELADQDPNMARQLRRVLNEYGLIVVGYGGGDASVMNVLTEISEQNDLYWCIRRGEEPNEAVQQLLRDKRGFLVEIEGFDEMMNEIRPIVEFDVKKMLGSIEQRRNQIIKQLQKFDLQYSMDILGDIVDAAKEPATKGNKDKKINALDFFVRAYEAQQANELSQAENLYRKAIEIDPEYSLAYNNLGKVLGDLKCYAEAEAAFRKAIELEPNHVAAYNNLGIVLRDLKRYDEAEAAFRKAIELDPNKSSIYLLALASIHKKLGQQSESNQYIAQARMLLELDDWYNLACVESVSGNTDAAIENLSHAAQLPTFNPDWARIDPDFEWIRDDPRFKEIVGEDR
jgi:tetratricopeptide (TPR) repeat protein